MDIEIPFDNSYARLPERFYSRTRPTPVRAPHLIRLNTSLARELRMDADLLEGATGAQLFAGNLIPAGAEPIAMAYAGHQFGNFVPQLGDGRAILLGEIVGRDGVRRDVQLKGSGRTPFSRGGDGRAALGPVVREYIVSEAMAALGVPTTRALAVVATGEQVARERMVPGGIVTRVAAGHVRVGTFEFFASRGDTDGVRRLADYVIGRHYPDAADTRQPYTSLLEAVIRAQAELIAAWLLLGFIHGVMNTDNMSVAGETIDYGPCAFIDEYNPAMSFSAIDRWGRYAYQNQPSIGQWNLARFAECLLPLLHEDGAADGAAAVAEATAALDAFPSLFDHAYRSGLGRKLGLETLQDGDVALQQELLKAMHDNGADFTLTFRLLSDAAAGPEHDEPVRRLFIEPEAFDRWAARWRQRLEQEPAAAAARRDAMRRVNPVYIPRNHQVEAVIRAAEDNDDFAPFHALVGVLAAPFDERPEHARYLAPPQPHERVLQTFCGT